MLPAFPYTPPASPGIHITPPVSIKPNFKRPKMTRSKTSEIGPPTMVISVPMRDLIDSRPSIGIMTQPPSPVSGTTISSTIVPFMSTQQERKAAEMEAQRLQAEEELKANGGKPDEAQRERVALTDLCRALKVQMHEITPDGHCLYAAVADQLNILGKSHSNLNYIDTRKATAEYMRTHADDFMPFISDSDEHMAGIENKEAGKMTHNMSQQEKYFLGYCDAIEKTAVWGGQPEILALSRAYHTPIHVVQAGSPVVKVGTEEASDPEEVPVIISYHRHMYGLGEHYNSLHKVKAG